MSSENDNPYQPPAVESMPAADEVEYQPSILRGVLYAMPMAAIGFVIPFLFFFITTLIIRVSTDSPYPTNGLYNDVLRAASIAWWPGLGVAYYFGLAAILNYTPAKRIGFVNALMCFGLAILLAVWTVDIVEGSTGLDLKSNASEFRESIRLVIVLCVPLIYTIIHTAIRFRLKPSRNNSHLLKDETP